MNNGIGYIELSKGDYVGELSIDGVNISPIIGLLFKDNGKSWLWLKRKKILEYDFQKGEYYSRTPTPIFEVYLKRKTTNGKISYYGEFVFFKFKYSIVGMWSSNKRIELYIDRLPDNEQKIVNRLKEINENA